MLLKHWFAHTSTNMTIVPQLSASLWGDKYYDLSILPCKFLVHTYIVFRLSIVNIKILALQSGHLTEDEISQLLLVQAKNLMMLIGERLNETLAPHDIDIYCSHTVLI